MPGYVWYVVGGISIRMMWVLAGVVKLPVSFRLIDLYSVTIIG